jgi:hypothetical protein
MRNTPVAGRRSAPARKQELVVNCFFDASRQPVRRTTKLPQTLGPVYPAGAFRPAPSAVPEPRPRALLA